MCCGAVLLGTRRLLHVRRCHSISPAGGAPSSKPTARCCSRDRWDRRTERTDAVPLHVPLHSIWAVQIRIRALCHVCLEQSETSVNPALTMFPGALSFLSQQCVKKFLSPNTDATYKTSRILQLRTYISFYESYAQRIKTTHLPLQLHLHRVPKKVCLPTPLDLILLITDHIHIKLHTAISSTA